MSRPVLHSAARHTLIAVGLTFLIVPALPHGNADPRRLTFEARVSAQEAIERAYYAHQIGATRPFEEIVPRDLMETKVRTYLNQSTALERVWGISVTGEMLGVEVRRMTERTRMPGRLRELFAALGNDPLLIQECLARPLLVSRLARQRFAEDRAIHAPARLNAESLRARLESGAISPSFDHPLRTVIHLVRRDTSSAQGSSEPLRLRLPGMAGPGTEVDWEIFEQVARRLPKAVGDVGPVIETDEAFIVHALLEKTPARLRFAQFTVGKPTWDEWWKAAAVRSDLEPNPFEPSGSLSTLVLPSVEAVCVPDTWSPTATTGAPAPRQEHTAIWTGTHIVIWGGLDYVGDVVLQLNTGGRYDPATDTWLPTTTTGAPVNRAYHSAVWTGSEMIVWGGGLSSPKNTGGRYDPVSDTWIPTSTRDAPLGRIAHTAVWTGEEMIVWGGEGDCCLFWPESGGRYSPAADRWLPMSSVDAPQGRWLHAAVWTGAEMVVWGGTNPQPPDYLNTGGRYDPVADSWQPTSVVGAPTARQGLWTVWTGNEMITPGGTVPTGGRYNPDTDTWRPVAAASFPLGIGSPASVWTGSLKIELRAGGAVGVGLYDPALDAWSPGSTTGAPSRRNRFTVVWTGSQAAVWGGEVLTIGGTYDETNDGGLYCPCTPTTFYQDADGDGHGSSSVATQACRAPSGYVANAQDCDDNDLSVWTTPSEVMDLGFVDQVSLGWSTPVEPGGLAVLYDLLRSVTAADFTFGTECLVSDGPDRTTTDQATPAEGTAFYYLTRAVNGCPAGDGPLGNDSGGRPRPGRACP